MINMLTRTGLILFISATLILVLVKNYVRDFDDVRFFFKNIPDMT